GNPVSAAACMAVLDVIDDEGLQENAATVSAHLLARLRALRHPLLADVRGAGLFFAAEFVQADGVTPASDFAGDLVEALVAAGFILNRAGRAQHVLKIRPPLPFSLEHADLAMDAIERALRDTPVPA
ncbi:MAG: aminotransferase class III-fold pyridoxal phosphate-dependent enzyme, partial [Rhodobacterales bacterium]|nr:aminotransferase class III-fold pyridoxal phosphate-dependent enzyme [Rhodobacterales bacterium]